jgi:hypothetical protein
MIAPDFWQAQESQDAERHSAPPVRWRCVFCSHEVSEEWSACCGEVGHTEPIPEGYDDDVV